MYLSWGAWVPQSVKPQTLGFHSACDLRVVGSSPAEALCSALSQLGILSLSLSLHPHATLLSYAHQHTRECTLAHTLSLSLQ